MNQIQIGIIEDDLAYQTLLKESLNKSEHIEILWIQNHYDENLISTLKQPDIILLDIGLPNVSGVDIIPRLIKIFTGINILMLTRYEEKELIIQSFINGASGYLVKDKIITHLSYAIETTFQGALYISPGAAKEISLFFRQQFSEKNVAYDTVQVPKVINGIELQDREREVVQGLVDGLSYKLIADRFHISINTVRHYIRSVYQKFNVHNKNEVIRKAIQAYHQQNSQLK